MPIAKKRKVLKAKQASAKSNSNPELEALRKGLVELSDLKETANSATAAFNRKKTVLKNIIHKFAVDNGGTQNDGVIIDGTEIAYRPNISEEINPRVWVELWQSKRITDNQFFKALNVSVTDARNAYGNDQIAGISHETLTKTADLRIVKNENYDDYNDGVIVKFAGAKVKTAKEARQVEVDTVGKPIAKTNKKVGRKLRITR